MARSTIQKKLQLARAWASGNPVWCSWQVTYRCNFRCAFCRYWCDPAGDEQDLPVEAYREGSRKLSRLGALLISLAGGEPLVRPDIVQIVEAIATWHMPFLTTNGWFVTDSLARDLFEAGMWGVSVSIDYADARRHDRRRGMPGAFERALAAIEMFSRARLYRWQRVNWLAVLLEDNLDQIEPMIRMAAERDAYFMVQPYGIRKTGSRRFMCPSDGLVGEYLLSLRRKYPNFLSNAYFLSRFDEALNGGVPGCMAGRGFFNIDSTGDIAVCVEERGRPVGNLFRDSVETIMQRLRKDPAPRRCRACWYNCRGEIESLYSVWGVWSGLGQVVFDRGRPSTLGAWGRFRPGHIPKDSRLRTLRS